LRLIRESGTTKKSNYAKRTRRGGPSWEKIGGTARRQLKNDPHNTSEKPIKKPHWETGRKTEKKGTRKSGMS